MPKVILHSVLPCLLMGLGFLSNASAGPVTFINDYQGFLAAAGDVRVIDFETLPDGTPTLGSESYNITPEFNYTDQGITFSSSIGNLLIGGNSVSGFELIADAYDLQHPVAVIADLDPAASAVGVFFVGGLELSVYNQQEQLIKSASLTFGSDPFPWFIGIVSDEPIFRAVADQNADRAILLDFVYTPIPEPASIALLIFGSIAVVRKRLSVECTRGSS